MRWIRLLWVLVFLLPLGFFADRLCYINVVDPSYHALLWMHERLGYLFIGLALVSAAAALLRFARIQGQLRSLTTLRAVVPHEIERAFSAAASTVGLRRLDIVYVHVPMVFCFTVFGGRIVLSQGFVDVIATEELPLVALHEAVHIRFADPAKALLWHLFFAALIVPGFETIEDLLYQRRERGVDRFVSRVDERRYGALLDRFNASTCLGTPAAAFRSTAPVRVQRSVRPLLSAALPASLLGLLLLSHMLVLRNLPYLQTHHC